MERERNSPRRTAWSTLNSHGELMTSNSSPIEYLIAFGIVFLLGAYWTHTRGNGQSNQHGRMP